MFSELGQNECSEIAQKFREINRLAEQLHEEEKRILALLSNSCVELKSETEQAEIKKRAIKEALKELQFS